MMVQSCKFSRCEIRIFGDVLHIRDFEIFEILLQCDFTLSFAEKTEGETHPSLPIFSGDHVSEVGFTRPQQSANLELYI